jgi:predicted Zn-dependent protease
LAALVLVHAGVTTRHVYLDPTRENWLQLRAEHVLSLEDNVTAGAHADWVFEYALALEEEGDWARAADFYGRGLQLAPFSDTARARLVALERRLDPESSRSAGDPMDPRPRAGEVAPAEFARLPLWLEGQPLRALPSCEVGTGLEQVPSATIVVLRIGDVASSITEAIGHVLQEELALPACLVPEVLELPSATRYRGLVFGRQWSLDSLVEAMLPVLRRAPNAPLKFLLITPVDIYWGTSNFVFSSTYAWGAVLSYARFGDFESEPERVRYRTAKQSMGALVKSFGVPVSPDPNCVTSYTNGLPQFDAKGNRLNSESYSMFRERVDSVDRKWRRLRAP